jgi:hypothetical protein
MRRKRYPIPTTTIEDQELDLAMAGCNNNSLR